MKPQRTQRGAKVIAAMLAVTFIALQTPRDMAAQTIYTVVLGNQSYVVGSSTLRSGLFVSRDGGSSWRHVGPENVKGYSMDAVDSSGGRILYLAAGNGVHRSTDYGATWKIVTDWRMSEVMDVRVEQRDPSLVHAATAFGYWRSTDGGDTWENPEGPFADAYCYRMMGEPRDFRFYLYSFVKEYDAFAVGLFGDTIRVAAPWSISPSHYRGGFGIVSDRYLMYGENALYESLDPIELWHGTAQAFRAASLQTYPLSFTPFDVALIDHGAILAGRKGLWLLDSSVALDPSRIDAGLRRLPGPLDSTTVHAVAVDPTSEDLLAGTFGDGLWRYDGSAWRRSGLDGSQIWRIVVKGYDVPVEVGHEH